MVRSVTANVAVDTLFQLAAGAGIACPVSLSAGNIDGTVANDATRLASSTGNILGSIVAFPAFDSMC